jgi:glycosyltransferase involved in cell wall biosynthesis
VTSGATPAETAPIGSVVIPAWNEATVIGRTLDALHAGVPPGTLEVVVACNGCTDGTAEVARASGHPVRVLELGPVGKAGAIRAAEESTALLPRLYLDADTEMPGTSAVAVLHHLAAGGVAARPPAVYDTDGAAWPVRAFYRVRADLPSIRGELYGAGVYGLGPVARARFTTFPDLVADDLYAARIVDRSEVAILDCPPVTVRVPRRTRALVTTLARVHRGNRELAAHHPDLAPSTARGTMRDVLALLRSPRRIPDVGAYVTLTVAGRALSRAASGTWERDDSAREPAVGG